MTRAADCLWRAALALALLVVHAGARAALDIVPTHDDQVLETLAAPTVRGQSSAAADLSAVDVTARLGQVRAEIGLARQTGDTRYWGRAQALLTPWWDQPAAPVDMAVLQATVLQGRHAFEAARSVLRDVVARAPGHAQAWLNLAALDRLRGDYPASLHACDAVALAGATRYAAACRLETLSLQGKNDTAIAGLRAELLASQRSDQRSWLLSLLAEALERAGLDAQAELAYHDSLREQSDLYTAIALGDLLLRKERAQSALLVLQALAPTDAVLLRRAAALRRLGDARWLEVRASLRARATELLRRGDDPDLHGREAALIALWLDDDPRQALRLARRNLRLQREPVDWWVALRSAALAGDAAAWTDMQQQRKAAGLRDRRLTSLVPPTGVPIEPS